MVIAKLGGVRFRINFFLLLLCSAYVYLGLGREILIILSALILHELAHVVIARGLGIKISEVELLPFGGQAKIEDFTGLDPDGEIYVALAGPVVSLLVAGIFYFLPTTSAQSGDLTRLFININLLLGTFNLLPALPLDGGRVLRAVLSKIIGYKKATARSAAIGKVIATGIVGYSLYTLYQQQTGQHYLLVGILLFWAAHREGKLMAYVFMRYLVHKKSELSKKGILPSQQMVSRKDTLIKTIVEATRPTYYMIVIIVDEQHKIIGMRTEAELIEVLFERGPLVKLEDC